MIYSSPSAVKPVGAQGTHPPQEGKGEKAARQLILCFAEKSGRPPMEDKTCRRGVWGRERSWGSSKTISTPHSLRPKVLTLHFYSVACV